MASGSDQTPKPGKAPELVLAICHEVGNLLLAARLQGQLAADDAGARVSELCGRAGALVALARPLLATGPASPPAVEVAELLDALPRALDGVEEGRVRVESEGADRLPAVAVDADALLHLLLADVHAALAEPPVGAPVRVFAEADPDGVAFCVEGPAEPSASASPRVLSRRALTRALGDALLGSRRGAVRAAPAGSGARFCFVAPAAPPPA